MKLLCAILPLALLLGGCGFSERDVVGVYHLLAESDVPQPLALELKSDGTYVQTLRLAGSEPLVRTGKWSIGDWRDAGKSPGYFDANTKPYSEGTFVFLENANALERCPKCQAVPYEVVPFYVSAGMMNVALAQDPKGTVAYDK